MMSTTDTLPPSPTSPLSPSDSNFSLHRLDNKQSVKPYRTKDEFLYAMKEDLAEWFNDLYSQQLKADNLLESLQDGAFLCQHANNVKSHIELAEGPGSRSDIAFRSNAKPGSFQARDNLANFIQWTRNQLGINDVLLFESDDLVLLKNEKNVVLCLLEVARRGARYGMPAPLIVQLEQEIDQIERNARSAADRRHSCDGSEAAASDTDSDKASLDEWVQSAIQQCTCPKQFPMINLSKGKYRVGFTQNIVFVRILRNHVMIRVGGGWDTLEHYLDKHDPCRCRHNHREKVRQRSISSKQTPLANNERASPSKALLHRTRSQSVTELLPTPHSLQKRNSRNGSKEMLCSDLTITRTDSGKHVAGVTPPSPSHKTSTTSLGPNVSPSKSNSSGSIKQFINVNGSHDKTQKNPLAAARRRSCSPSSQSIRRSVSPSVELMRRLKASYQPDRTRSVSRTRTPPKSKPSSRDCSYDRRGNCSRTSITRKTSLDPDSLTYSNQSSPTRCRSTPATVRRESKPNCSPSKIPTPSAPRRPSNNNQDLMVSSSSTCGSLESLRTV